MDIILIPGLWLTADAWSPVEPGLTSAGHRPVPLDLPNAPGRTLDDQLQVVEAAIDAATGPVFVVGHSAASTLAWLAADRRPDRVAGVAMVGGMPVAQGAAYAPFFAAEDGVMEFPGWEPFAGPDSDDLTEQQKDEISDAAMPMPESVTHAPVNYTNEARKQVPVTLVCPEFSPEDAKAWFDAGEMPELVGVQLSYVNIDSGHWPMFSAPDELAQILVQLADQSV